jgi:hypothetical protein
VQRRDFDELEKCGGSPLGSKAKRKSPLVRRAGRKPRLSTKDRQWLEALSLHGSECLGYKTSLWACRRVADLIESACGIIPAMSGRC